MARALMRGKRPPASTDRLTRRMLERSAGVAFLGLTIAYGLLVGGHLEEPGSPFAGLPGKVAGYFGYAADEIRITGLKWQTSAAVLTAIGVTPGRPLVGFEAARAKRLLENLDWVKSAHVQRLFPNQLEIRLVERQPFAVWQREGRFYVIDETGTALTSVGPRTVPGLPLLTGEGAQTAAKEIVNQLAAHPALASKMKAAGRVGDRRWNLYFAGPVKVLLPESEMGKALKVLAALDQEHQILEKDVREIDLRQWDRIVVSLPPVKRESDGVLAVNHQ